MTIEYTVTEQDYCSFTVYHLNHSEVAQKNRKVLRHGSPFHVLLISLIVFFMVFKYAMIWPLIAWPIMMTTYPIYYDMSYERRLRKHIKIQLSEGKNNNFLGDQKLSLTKGYIVGTNRVSTSYMRYSAVEKIGYGFNCFFVYVGAMQAYIIPVSTFSTVKERDKFINIIVKKAGMSLSDIVS